MYRKTCLVFTDILLILGLVVTGSSSLFWYNHQQALAQPQPQPPQQLQQPSSVSNALTYADSICAIRIQYPPNWDATGFGSGGAQFSVPRLNDTFSISMSPFSSSSLGSSPSLESHARNTLDSLRKDLGQNFQLIKSGKTTLAGNPALSIEYRFRDVGGFGLGLPASDAQQAEVKRTLDIFTAKGDKLYTLSYSAPDVEYPRYLSTINSMISTFVIGNPSSACRPDDALLSLGGFGGGFSGGFGGGGVDPSGGDLAESFGAGPLDVPPLGATPGNDVGGFDPTTPGQMGGSLTQQQPPPGSGQQQPQQQPQSPAQQQPQGIPAAE